MKERKFKVIKGGLDIAKTKSNRTFISAYVTNTRLMGVVGAYARWLFNEGNTTTEFHQFFYFDAEEYGFETYRSLLGSDPIEQGFIEQALIGGLGGKKIEVSEEELSSLVKDYTEMNKRLSIPLPEGIGEYGFLLDTFPELTEEEKTLLFAKQCTPINGTYELINYFLMRAFSRDFKAAQYLTAENMDIDLPQDQASATLCKNTIRQSDTLPANPLREAFLCESLLEIDNRYVLVLSEVEICPETLLVTDFHQHTQLKISPSEAALLLAREEYISLYEVFGAPEQIDSLLGDLSKNSLITTHENGKLFLSFNPNNDHVGKDVFRLNDDIFGIYYFTDYGQLLATAYSIQGIQALEKALSKKPLNQYLVLMSKYEFKEPILYEFIQSAFEDFEEFLDLVMDDRDPEPSDYADVDDDENNDAAGDENSDDGETKDDSDK